MKTTMGLLLSAGLVASAANAGETDLFTGKHGEYQQSSGKVVATYVANWSEPSAVKNINGNNLTHILYAFLDICGPGQRAGHEATCADKPDFSLAENERTVDKAFAASFSALKAQYPHLKILPSVGGWNGDGPFAPMAMDSTNRQFFVENMVTYLKANPAFDGVDIDWEFPKDPVEGEAYVDLMIDLDVALKKLGQETGREYLVTTAIPSTAYYINKVNYKRAESAIDLVFLMTYDFFGGWSSTNIGHHTAISAHSENLANGYGYGAENGIENALAAGLPADKLVLGVAKYAKGWDGVVLSPGGSPIGGNASGLFPKPVNVWDEAGIAVYSRLVNEVLGPDGKGINGFEIVYDKDCQCHYAWRATDAAFIGFDHPADVVAKGELALSRGLAGLFSWEYGQDNGDLLNAMNIGVGNTDMNALPDAEVWQADTVYLTGDKVVFNGDLYQAKWWTQNNVPGSMYGPWMKVDLSPNGSWSADKIYHAGDRATFNGVLYEAQWWTQNNEPGGKYGPWVAI
ncbi:glycosyl hydrolase family 18 protein [Enterovibrio paralichthyis]|uniref:glycosyl hydrolase family 18 protein n=1 Tax=Enterovibrio paralichthyis TaxID=2853805 RepID=UPI001C46F4E5|nr:glycosyl hydrolase family 18 protein [Enterovibrio paralichthyis]MBV7300359.1 hypothetical protein [Enterovibrio paralichthyis]